MGADITVELLAVQVGYVRGRLQPLFPGDAIYSKLAKPKVSEMVEFQAVERMTGCFHPVYFAKFHVKQGKGRRNQELRQG